MEIIPVEIVAYIVNCFGLDVVSQLSFLMACKHCYRASSALVITNCVEITRHSSYLKHYHSMRNVRVIKKVITLPCNVHSVTFSSNKSTISIEHLPASVKHLTLAKKFNKPLPRLPDGLKSLTLGERFNQPIDCLPANLQTLELGAHFNQPINHLPATLTELELDYDFNQPILTLPSSLQYLYLSWKFNQSIDHCLPEGLKALYLGYYFNQPIHCLPASLTLLHLGSINYDYTLDKCLPQGLRVLKLNSFKNLPDISTLSFDVRIYVWKPQVSDGLVIVGKKKSATIYRRKRTDE